MKNKTCSTCAFCSEREQVVKTHIFKSDETGPVKWCLRFRVDGMPCGEARSSEITNQVWMGAIIPKVGQCGEDGKFWEPLP